MKKIEEAAWASAEKVAGCGADNYVSGFEAGAIWFADQMTRDEAAKVGADAYRVGCSARQILAAVRKEIEGE